MTQRTRGFIMTGTALLGLALNVVDAADRGSSAWNILAIVCFAILLFCGFGLIAKSGPPAAT